MVLGSLRRANMLRVLTFVLAMLAGTSSRSMTPDPDAPPHRRPLRRLLPLARPRPGGYARADRSPPASRAGLRRVRDGVLQHYQSGGRERADAALASQPKIT